MNKPKKTTPVDKTLFLSETRYLKAATGEKLEPWNVQRPLEERLERIRDESIENIKALSDNEKLWKLLYQTSCLDRSALVEKNAELQRTVDALRQEAFRPQDELRKEGK